MDEKILILLFKPYTASFDEVLMNTRIQREMQTHTRLIKEGEQRDASGG